MRTGQFPATLADHLQHSGNGEPLETSLIQFGDVDRDSALLEFAFEKLSFTGLGRRRNRGDIRCALRVFSVARKAWGGRGPNDPSLALRMTWCFLGN